MIAISSHRPKAICTPEIWENQVAAYHSWKVAFDRIIYFGAVEEDLTGPNVEFWPCDGKPTIKQLCTVASGYTDWSCILNADILIGFRFPAVKMELRRFNVECAISRRYEIEDNHDFLHAKLVDLGLDFFAAHPHIWKRAAEEVPERFHLGKILWDTWMLGCFMHSSRGNCADITPSKVIFHPKHGDRSDQHADYQPHKYLDRVVWPGFQIGKDWQSHPPVVGSGPRPPGGGGTLKI